MKRKEMIEEWDMEEEEEEMDKQEDPDYVPGDCEEDDADVYLMEIIEISGSSLSLSEDENEFQVGDGFLVDDEDDF